MRASNAPLAGRSKTFRMLLKAYEDIADQLAPEVREQFEAIPEERRDWFQRQLFSDPMVPGVMNTYAYNQMQVAQREGVHVKLDLNDLKALNDKHGHEVGNQAIKAFAGAALAAARAHKGQLFRTGGDEFDAHFAAPEQAYGFLRHAHAGVGGVVPLGGSHRPSFCAGVGSSPDHADKAMYHAKEAKKMHFGDLRSDPNAITGHGVNFAHSLLADAAGPVRIDRESEIPDSLRNLSTTPVERDTGTKSPHSVDSIE